MRRTTLVSLTLAMIIISTGNNITFAGELPGVENVMAATGETSEEKVEGDYTYTLIGGCATITAYCGTEENIVIPESLGGCPVTEIGKRAFSDNGVRTVVVSEGVVSVREYAFLNCQNLYKIEFPSTLQEIGYGGLADTTNLEQIDVSKDNAVFFSDDGILFKHVSKGITLYTYPAAKREIEYRIPHFATSIMSWAFSDMQYLTKLIVPDTISYAYDRIFCESKKPIDVYLNHAVMPEFTAEMFYNMPSGCHVIVKNDQVKKSLEAINIFSAGLSYETPNSSIIILGTDGYPAIPTTNLTWDGSKVKEAHTLSPGEVCQLTYVQEPSDSTDHITWSSSDEKIARVNAITGLVEASGSVNYPVRTGTCTITGIDESGHSISVDVTVYKPVEKVELGFNELRNPVSYEAVLDECSNTQWIGMYAEPVSANNAGNVIWESSDPEVAEIRADEDEKENALLTYLAPGITIITAALNDNGTVWTKSFVLTVTKSISDCTITSISDQIYTGSALKPTVTVKDGRKTLMNGTDYTIAYRDNIKAGTATAFITGRGLYYGTAAVKYNIIKKDNNGGNTAESGGDNPPNDIPSTLKRQSITGIRNSYRKQYGSKGFTLRAKAKGNITYISGNSRVVAVNKKTGRVTMKGTGVCTITVIAARTSGYNRAVKRVVIYVTPGKENITYARSCKKSQLTVKWKRDTKATGYEIQYSASRKFTKKTTKSVTVKNNRITSRTIKKLKAGKRYYVRVRSYRIVKVRGKSKKLYGSWSQRKSAGVR